jgi:hypothetical protein
MEERKILMDKNKKRKASTIRLDYESYTFLKEAGALSNRSISGQANWAIRVLATLQEEYPDLYAEISHKLNQDE